MTDPLAINREDDLTGETAGALIKALNAELSARYPEDGATHFRLDPEEVKEGRGAFLVATIDGVPMACGAIRRLDEQAAEIKRMYVSPDARGRGLGRRVLSALEDEAVRLKVTRIVLETGIRQHEALALYERTGFRRIPAFGEYIGSMHDCSAQPPGAGGWTLLTAEWRTSFTSGEHASLSVREIDAGPGGGRRGLAGTPRLAVDASPEWQGEPLRR